MVNSHIMETDALLRSDHQCWSLGLEDGIIMIVEPSAVQPALTLWLHLHLSIPQWTRSLFKKGYIVDRAQGRPAWVTGQSAVIKNVAWLCIKFNVFSFLHQHWCLQCWCKMFLVSASCKFHMQQRLGVVQQTWCILTPGLCGCYCQLGRHADWWKCAEWNG